MPVDIGTARVVISGDYSRLASDFAAAQGVAATGARNISTAVGGAYQQSSLLVDQFGRAITSTITPVKNATTATLDYSAAGKELAETLIKIAGAEVAEAEATEAVATAHQHAVSEIQATSGALRVIEGNGGIRAAERFLATTLRLGPILTAAFPVVGAIALGAAIEHLIGRTEELKKAQEELAQQTEAADQAMQSEARTIATINIDAVRQLFGGAAGSHAQATQLRQDLKATQDAAGDLVDHLRIYVDEATDSWKLALPSWLGGTEGEIRAKINTVQEALRNVRSQARVITEQIADDERQATRQRAIDGAQAQIAALANVTAATQREADISKTSALAVVQAQREGEQQRIAGLDSEYARVVATGAEAVRAAQSVADLDKGYALAARDNAIAAAQARAALASVGQDPIAQAKTQIEAQGEIAAAKDAYRKQVTEADQAVTEATNRSTLAVIELNQKTAESLRNLVREGWDNVTAAAKRTQDGVEKSVDAQLAALARVQEVQAKSTGEVNAAKTQGDKLAVERAFALQLNKTSADQIAQQTLINSLDEKARNDKLDGLKAELAIAEAISDEGTKKIRVAEIQARITLLNQQGANESYAAQTKLLELEQQRSLRGQISRGLPQGSIIDQTTAATARTVVGVVDGISSGLAQAVVQGKNLGQVFSQIGKSLATSLLTDVLKASLGGLLRSLLQLVPAFGAVSAAQGAAAATAAATTSAINTGEVLSQAAVAAAGAAAAVAWIPLIGPELAAAASASMFATIAGTYAPIAAFAKGGRPEPGVPYLVGEQGPEIRIDDGPGTIIPNGAFALPAVNAGGTSLSTPGQTAVRNSSSSLSFGDVHLHGVQDVRGLMREISRVAKNSHASNNAYNN